MTNPTIFTSRRGEPITQPMLQAAQDVAAEHGAKVTEDQTRTVLDFGLPYSMVAVAHAAREAGIKEYLVDLMLDSAIAAID